MSEAVLIIISGLGAIGIFAVMAGLNDTSVEFWERLEDWVFWRGNIVIGLGLLLVAAVLYVVYRLVM